MSHYLLLFWLSWTNTESEINPNNNLMMRRAGLVALVLGPITQFEVDQLSSLRGFRWNCNSMGGLWRKLRRGLGMWRMCRIFAQICKLRKNRLWSMWKIWWKYANYASIICSRSFRTYIHPFKPIKCCVRLWFEFFQFFDIRCVICLSGFSLLPLPANGFYFFRLKQIKFYINTDTQFNIFRC